jgi:hypothetical protein
VNISILFATVVLSVVLAGCNRRDVDRTTSTPPGVSKSAEVMPPIVTPSAPPAPAMRGPVAENANAAAPGTDATAAFAAHPPFAAKPPPGKGGPPQEQHVTIAAQEAAAKAPDTATADAAKKRVLQQAENHAAQPHAQ